jgi:protein-tyrosine phosphatase
LTVERLAILSVNNFSWVIPRKLGGCALPNFTIEGTAAWLAEQGVDMLVSFALPPGPVEKECSRNGIEWVYYPVDDYGVPDDRASFAALVDKIVEAVKGGRGVCLHCYAGIGRTGMGLACAVGKYLSLPYEQAVAAVRKARESIESVEQENFTKAFLNDCGIE